MKNNVLHNIHYEKSILEIFFLMNATSKKLLETNQ